MRFDNLPTELIVRITKCSDPFTKDQIRLTNKQMKTIVDNLFQWKLSLESLSVGLGSSGAGMSAVRLRTCTIDGKRHIRLYSKTQQRDAVLAEILEKITYLRSLHLCGIPIENSLLTFLEKIEQMGYLNEITLEECSIEVGKTVIFELLAKMKLKGIRIIKCPGAQTIVDDDFIKFASEEFVVEGDSTRFKSALEDDSQHNSMVISGEVSRRLSGVKTEIFRFHMSGNTLPTRWDDLNNDKRSLEKLGAEIEKRDRVALNHRMLGGLNNQLEYQNISKHTLIYMKEHPLRRFELRNVTTNDNITMAAVAELIKDAVEKDNEVHWNFGRIFMNKIQDLQSVSNISNIIWTHPTWMHGMAQIGYTYNTIEMKTTDKKKTFIFQTNVN